MEATPGLLRIICIDAHIADKRMEVKLPHHAGFAGAQEWLCSHSVPLQLIPLSATKRSFSR